MNSSASHHINNSIVSGGSNRPGSAPKHVHASQVADSSNRITNQSMTTGSGRSHWEDKKISS
jgi:hypothetical protein